jgi:DNA-binding response OmpR family regulator
MNKLSTIKKSENNRIFFVDNEFDNTLVFEMALEDNGFIVDTFNDSLLALSTFKIDLYDLVILDINIPKMDGYELYREIRKIDNNDLLFVGI